MTGSSQSIIIKGDSGSGKTFAVRECIKYLSFCSQSKEKAKEIMKIIEAADTVIDAFGSAKTTNNNTSSRFGKFVEIFYGNSKEI